MKLKVFFYKTPAGISPVEKHLGSLEEAESAAMYAVLAKIQQHGLDASLIKRRSLGSKLHELKFRKQRIYYVLISGPAMMLLHAGKKQGQKARRTDLDLARKRLKKVFTAK